MEIPLTLQSEDAKLAYVKDDKVMILGATFQALTGEEKQKLRTQYGFKVVSLDNGKLKTAGIKPGFILLTVDREPVRTVSGLKDALSSRNGGVLIEGIYPNGLRAYYGIGL